MRPGSGLMVVEEEEEEEVVVVDSIDGLRGAWECVIYGFLVKLTDETRLDTRLNSRV